MAEFHCSDLTFIIPTIGGDLKVLSQVIQAIKAEAAQVKVVVVWDGRQPLAAQTRSQMLQDGAVKVIEHAENRGLSAARNTGIDHCQTSLAMFVDDDIVPQSGIVAQLLAFHNAHPAPLQAVMGKVTWEGTDFANRITRWNETKGNWNVFHTTVSGARFSNFMGGFTSFKTAAFRAIRFDESFKKYGCEDTEFGLRFFGLGGELVFIAEIVGEHHKAVSATSYCREHLAAGYSKALLAFLHPDDCFQIGYFRTAMSRHYSPAFFDGLCVAADALNTDDDATNDTELADLLAMLTSCAMLSGYARYFREQYPQFATFDFRPTNSAIDLNQLVDFAPLALEYASLQRQDIDALSFLTQLQQQMPHYFAPYKLAWQMTQDISVINRFEQQAGAKSLSVAVRRAIAQSRHPAAAQQNRGLTARELYKNLLTLPDSATSEINQLAVAIVQQDPTYVGAYIKLAQSLQSQTELALLLCSVARYFAALRPRLEQQQHLANIAVIEQQQDRS
ncbi:MAG: glycosyltransferase [Gammaproteobacteria bacterium]|nr:glycosyltransferase [Gammaproteobacteria bacterium]